MQPGPGYYAPQPAIRDPNAITTTDVLIPIGLSVFCGIGGFVWGLIRMVQGHHKPGWVAIGVNVGVWSLGAAIWLAVVMLFVGAVESVPTPPVGSALGSPAISAAAPAKTPEKLAPAPARKRP